MARVGPTPKPGREEFRKQLFRAVRSGNYKELESCFDKIGEKTGRRDKLPLLDQHYRNREEGNETLLHHAVLHAKPMHDPSLEDYRNRGIGNKTLLHLAQLLGQLPNDNLPNKGKGNETLLYHAELHAKLTHHASLHAKLMHDLLKDQDYRNNDEGNKKLRDNPKDPLSDHRCMKSILEKCPQLIYERKTLKRTHKGAGHMHLVYEGQTALHIAVARKDLIATTMILDTANDSDASGRSNLLHDWVIGKIYKDTCMEGELPLSIAAWNADIKMIDILLKYGAQRDAKNSKGDTVFHTLVKLFSKQAAQENEERQEKLKDTFEHLLETVEVDKEITKDILSLYKETSDKDTDKYIKAYFLSLTNRRNLTPLALAARKGVHSIFKTILDVKGVYKFLDDTDGVSDVYLYDVTEIDSAVSRNKNTSVMETIPFHKPKQALQFMEISPIKEIIQAKWSRYRWIFLVWALLHFMMMTFITYSISKRPLNVTDLSNDTNLTSYLSGSIGCGLEFWSKDAYQKDGNIHSLRVVFDVLFAIYILILLFFETISFILELKHTAQATKHKGTISWKQLKKYMPRYLDNGLYRIILIIFILSSISTVVFKSCDYKNEDEPIVVGLICGWCFMMFFTRPYKKFTFFTLLVQKVVFGDLLRFLFAFMVLLVAFASAMFVQFQNPKIDPRTGNTTIIEEFESLEITMFSLFKLAFGLIDMDVLSDSSKPHLTAIIFIVFVVLTYVLLMIMLIAVLYKTMSITKNDKTNQWQLQRLSVILFIEPRLLPFHRFSSATKKSPLIYVSKSDPENESDIKPKEFELQENPRYYQTIKTKTTQTFENDRNTYLASTLFDEDDSKSNTSDVDFTNLYHDHPSTSFDTTQDQQTYQLQQLTSSLTKGNSFLPNDITMESKVNDDKDTNGDSIPSVELDKPKKLVDIDEPKSHSNRLDIKQGRLSPITRASPPLVIPTESLQLDDMETKDEPVSTQGFEK